MSTSPTPPAASERLPLSAVVAFLPIETIPLAAVAAKDWAAAAKTPPANANWRARAIIDFELASGGEDNFSVRPFDVWVVDSDEPWEDQRKRLLAPFITDSPLRLDLDWRRIYFDLRRIWAEGIRMRARSHGIEGERRGPNYKSRLSPHFGGLNGDESNSEDAQRGRELRCTYGLAAVREEQERWLASINRQCWASFDPSGEIREAARSFKNL